MESDTRDILFGKVVTAVTELAKGMKAVAFYPANHPSLKKALVKICNSIEEIPSSDSGIEISVSKPNLSFEDQKLPERHDAITDFRNALFIRRAKKLIVLPGVTPDDMRHFLAAISEDPDELLKRGGLETVLIGRKVSKIWVNKVDYEKLMEELKKEQEQELNLEDEDIIVFEDTPMDTDPMPEEDHIDALLIALAETTSSGEYRDLVLRISKKINEMIRNERLHYTEKAFKIFAHHVEFPPSGDEEIKRIAVSSIQELGEESVIDLYVKKFGSKSLQERNEAQIVLLIIGERAVKKILEALTEEKDLIVRKAIVDLTITIGEPAVPFIVAYLEDDRWYVIRNMITILGGVGSEEVVPHIANTLKNPDPRVKKETIKALSKITSPLAITALGECCYESDENIASISITALGTKKDDKAVQILHERFLTKKFIYPDYRVAKDVIDSLKNIGTESAVDVLDHIARYSPIIKPKRVRELKALAVHAIGKIKSEKSMETLHRLARNSDRICKLEATKLLKRFGYGEDGT